MPTYLSSSDSEVTKNCSEILETPFHENLRTCTRQTPCGKQSCLTCLFPADSNSILCTMQNSCTKHSSRITKNFSDFPEFPIHENLWSCTRQTPCGKQPCLTCTFTTDSNSLLCTMQIPCFKQTCLVCFSPTDGNHIWNLTTTLNTTTSKATIATRPLARLWSTTGWQRFRTANDYAPTMR